jgi:hypothetical protein
MSKTSREVLVEEKPLLKQFLEEEHMLKFVEDALSKDFVKETLDNKKVTFSEKAIKCNMSFPKEFQWDLNRIIHWVNSVWPDITDNVEILSMKSVALQIKVVQKLAEQSDMKSLEEYRQKIIDSINDKENFTSVIQSLADCDIEIYEEKLKYVIAGLYNI